MIDLDALTEHLYGDKYNPDIAAQLQDENGRISKFYAGFRAHVADIDSVDWFDIATQPSRLRRVVNSVTDLFRLLRIYELVIVHGTWHDLRRNANSKTSALQKAVQVGMRMTYPNSNLVGVQSLLIGDYFKGRRWHDAAEIAFETVLVSRDCVERKLMRERNAGFQFFQLATVLSELGGAKYVCGKPREAEEFLNEAQDIFQSKTHYSAEHESEVYLSNLTLLAWVRWLKGDFNAALASLDEKAARLGSEDDDMLFQRAMIHVTRGDSSAAIAIGGPLLDRTGNTTVQHLLAIAHWQDGRSLLSVELLTEILDVGAEVGETKSLDYGLVANNLGMVLLEMGAHDRAQRFLDVAEATLADALPAETPVMQLVLKNLRIAAEGRDGEFKVELLRQPTYGAAAAGLLVLTTAA